MYSNLDQRIEILLLIVFLFKSKLELSIGVLTEISLLCTFHLNIHYTSFRKLEE